LLYKGLQVYGVGKWKEMNAELFGGAWDDTQLRIRAAKLMGSQSLARYVGWKGSKVRWGRESVEVLVLGCAHACLPVWCPYTAGSKSTGTDDKTHQGYWVAMHWLSNTRGVVHSHQSNADVSRAYLSRIHPTTCQLLGVLACHWHAAGGCG
jgi:hypothetical protein